MCIRDSNTKRLKRLVHIANYRARHYARAITHSDEVLTLIYTQACVKFLEIQCESIDIEGKDQPRIPAISCEPCTPSSTGHIEIALTSPLDVEQKRKHLPEKVNVCKCAVRQQRLYMHVANA